MWQPMWQLEWHKNYILVPPLVILEFSIQHLTAMTILTQYQNVKDQIDIFKRPGTKLTNSLKDKDQICHLPFIKLSIYII